MVGRDPVDRPAPPGGSEDTADSCREFRHPLLALMLAVVTAGALDSFAYLRYGVFVANQSGNTLFLGIGSVGLRPEWPASAASLVAFALGAGIVNWLRGAVGRWPPVVINIVASELTMSFWAVLNALGGYGRRDPTFRVVLVATGAFAMGSLTTLFSRTGGVATAISYQSGTVRKTGERAVRWLLRDADPARNRTGTLVGLLGIASYLVGGGLGALAQTRPRWVPVWGALALATLVLMIRRRDGRPGHPARQDRPADRDRPARQDPG